MADVAHHRAHHLPEGGARRALELPCATTPDAGLDRRSRLGAIAVTALASCDRVEGDLDLGAASCFEQADLDRHAEVFAGGRAGARGEGAAAEERLEQVADRAEAVEVGRESARGQALVSVAVIDRAPLGVGQDLVGLGRLLELLLGRGVVGVDIGVQFAREHAKSLLDLLLGGIAGDAEHLIGIARHLFLVDVLDEPRELLSGLADGGDRHAVVHPHRPEHRDRAQRAPRQPIGLGHERR